MSLSLGTAYSVPSEPLALERDTSENLLVSTMSEQSASMPLSAYFSSSLVCIQKMSGIWPLVAAASSLVQYSFQLVTCTSIFTLGCWAV